MAEVAGIALAVLPLLARTAEHFERTYHLFRRFRKYSAELDEFQSELKIQRTIFTEECRFLLVHQAGDEQASEMISNPSHHLWKDHDLSNELSSYLGQSKEACIENIEMIEKRLQALESDREALDQNLKATKKSRSPFDKAWRKEMRHKLKFIFSESFLNRNLEKIRHLNTTFRQITDQLSRHYERRPDNMKPTSLEQRKDIDKFHLVQKASAHLYDALATACTVHNEHVANISLQPILAAGEISQVRFRVSYSPANSTKVKAARQLGDTVWFNIESVVSSPSASRVSDVKDTLSGLGKLRKREQPSESSNACQVQKKRKAVRFASPERTPVTITITASPLLPQTLKPNFCTRIKNCPRHQQSTDSCLGPLDEASDIRHLVYLASHTPEDGTKKVSSLQTILKDVSYSIGSLPVYEKFRFCKLLAIATLQFHATPWLKNAWRSEDILVSNSPKTTDHGEPPQYVLGLESLYTNVPIYSQSHSEAWQTDASTYAFPANKFLFGLGAIMLEIAIEKPLASLRKPVDSEQCHDERHTDFFTAQRLIAADLTSTAMGTPFSKMVKKCIFCDFGRGQDLNKPELQASVYREVVCELSRLETKFRELQLGP